MVTETQSIERMAATDAIVREYRDRLSEAAIEAYWALHQLGYDDAEIERALDLQPRA